GEWLMGHGARQGSVTVQNMTGWTAIANGDFNGNGTDDVIWRNADGVTAVWFMQNGQIFGTTSLGSTAGLNVVTTGDFNHDGVADVMWQDASSGAITTWPFDPSGDLILVALRGRLSAMLGKESSRRRLHGPRHLAHACDEAFDCRAERSVFQRDEERWPWRHRHLERQFFHGIEIGIEPEN